MSFDTTSTLVAPKRKTLSQGNLIQIQLDATQDSDAGSLNT